MGGAIGLGALIVGGCGSSGKVPTRAVEGSPPPVQSTDVSILNRLLDLERQTVAAYTAGIPLLPRPEARTARQFLDEELEHTGELLSLIKAADGVSVGRRPSYDLGHPHSAGRGAHAITRPGARPGLAVPGRDPAALARPGASGRSHDPGQRRSTHRHPAPGPGRRARPIGLCDRP